MSTTSTLKEAVQEEMTDNEAINPKEGDKKSVSESIKLWSKTSPTDYYLFPKAEQFNTLKPYVYTLNVSPSGDYYLTHIQDSFNFDFKIYGLCEDFINIVSRTWEYKAGNLGILMNGVRGTGKTVASKIIANNTNLPIILINFEIGQGGVDFLDSIPQDVVIFIDEYEKIFEDRHTFLSIMDGVMSSNYKRMFLLTTNNQYINENLRERPSRIRYIKEFDSLSPDIVEEIVDDCLVYKEYRDSLIDTISTLNIITVDVVKSIIEEVNIQDMDPNNFIEHFNVRALNGNTDVNILTEDGYFLPLLTNLEDVRYAFTDPKNTISKGAWLEWDYPHVNGIDSTYCQVVEQIGPTQYKMTFSDSDIFYIVSNEEEAKDLGLDWELISSNVPIGDRPIHVGKPVYSECPEKGSEDYEKCVRMYIDRTKKGMGEKVAIDNGDFILEMTRSAGKNDNYYCYSNGYAY